MRTGTDSSYLEGEGPDGLGPLRYAALYSSWDAAQVCMCVGRIVSVWVVKAKAFCQVSSIGDPDRLYPSPFPCLPPLRPCPPHSPPFMPPLPPPSVPSCACLRHAGCGPCPDRGGAAERLGRARGDVSSAGACMEGGRRDGGREQAVQHTGGGQMTCGKHKQLVRGNKQCNTAVGSGPRAVPRHHPLPPSSSCFRPSCQPWPSSSSVSSTAASCWRRPAWCSVSCPHGAQSTRAQHCWWHAR